MNVDDEANAQALATALGVEVECWDEEVAAFETDPVNWEDEIINPASSVVSDDESDDDLTTQTAPPPTLKEAATALHTLREWNRHYNQGADLPIHELARVIGVARAKAPNAKHLLT
ncbi:hypothetical protein AC1031_005085 [Aphanomyces cochlioides]|nr:hypothetical protein AC1031_005085 [Aphanomyces cochlioides]